MIIIKSHTPNQNSLSQLNKSCSFFMTCFNAKSFSSREITTLLPISIVNSIFPRIFSTFIKKSSFFKLDLVLLDLEGLCQLLMTLTQPKKLLKDFLINLRNSFKRMSILFSNMILYPHQTFFSLIQVQRSQAQLLNVMERNSPPFLEARPLIKS